MENISEQLSHCERDIQNLTAFISQSLEKLKCRMCEYNHLQRELYIENGIEKTQKYVDSLGG